MSGASTSSRTWFEVILFIIAGFVSIGLPLIPMGLAADSIPFPDLTFALFAAWLIRRPASAPLLGIVFIAVLGDTLLLRPMGLWALVLLIGTELLRVNEREFRDIPFMLEWLYVSLMLLLMLMAQNLLLLVSFDGVHAITDVMWHWLRTVAVYPIVVIVLHWGLRIRAHKTNKRPNRLGYVL